MEHKHDLGATTSLNHVLGYGGFSPNAAKVRRALWLPIIIAIFIGAVEVAVGVIGITTYYEMGPLAAAVIPTSALQGTVVNAANIAALISAGASIISLGTRRVYSGVTRSWLWRRSDGQRVARESPSGSGALPLHTAVCATSSERLSWLEVLS
jgi:hypothetical protein